MKSSKLAGLSLLIVVTTLVPSVSSPRILGSAPSLVQADCLDQIPSDGAWLMRLVDPVFTSQDDLLQSLAMFAKLDQCLKKNLDERSADEKSLYKLIEYFMLFVGDNAVTRVPFNTSADPALTTLREKVGITPPPGAAYVRCYTSRAAMPDLIKPTFNNEAVKGVTRFTRYIVVLDTEGDCTWNPAQSAPINRTYSHELTHAYVNSYLGLGKMDKLPEWYHEGIAIYFSHSGEPSVRVRGDQVITTISPEDYKQYALNFDYLENLLGQDHFLEVVRDSLNKADPSRLYTGLGITGIANLITRSRAWRDDKENKNRLLMIAGAIVVVVILGFVVRWFLSVPPEDAHADPTIDDRLKRAREELSHSSPELPYLPPTPTIVLRIDFEQCIDELLQETEISNLNSQLARIPYPFRLQLMQAIDCRLQVFEMNHLEYTQAFHQLYWLRHTAEQFFQGQGMHDRYHT